MACYLGTTPKQAGAEWRTPALLPGQALDSDPVQLAKNAALLANELNVGIEIDYEQDDGSRITALDTFIKTYRYTYFKFYLLF